MGVGLPGLLRSWMIRLVLCVLTPAAGLGMAQWLLIAPTWAPPRAQAAEVTSSPASDPAGQYQQRFARLARDDVAGHYDLAVWCRRQKQYELLLRQANYVLKLDPSHENARLLVSIATRQIEARRAAAALPPDEPAARPPGGEADADREFIAKKDIGKIRFAEVQDPSHSDREPAGRRDRGHDRRDRTGQSEDEFVRVRFGKDVLADFFEAMSGHEDFSSRRDRERFYDLTPTAKLQLIRKYKGDTYANRIEILSDPLSLRKFKKVLPVLVGGCAATGCHGGLNAAKPFRLRTARLNTEESLYTNFLILNRIVVGKYRLVDRASPKDSLVLQYGLPASYARKSHAPAIEVLFARGPRDSKYRTILDWIEALRFPHPRTGVELPGYPEPPPPGASLGVKSRQAKEQVPKGAPPGEPAPGK